MTVRQAEARAVLDGSVDEDELLSRIVLLIHASGGAWRMFHVRDSKRGVIQGPGAEGFPDLVLVGGSPHRILFRELKAEHGRVSVDQRRWLQALEDGGADAGIWRPSDWPTIERTIRGEDRPSG